MFGCIGYLMVACHAPLAHGRYDLQVRREGMNRDIEAYLVIAFACAAMCHGYGSLRTRHLNQQACDQRTSQGGCERILPLVDCSCLQCRPDEVTHKICSPIEHQRFDRPDLLSTSSDSRQI